MESVESDDNTCRMKRDTISENKNASTKKRVKPKGTMYKQSPLLFVLQDIYSPTLVYVCGNNDTKVLKEEDHPKDSQGGKTLEEKEFEEFYRHKATPTIPLEIQPLKNLNRYEYSFFYHTYFDTYYSHTLHLPLDLREEEKDDFDGLSFVQNGWDEGILSLRMNIDKDLK